MEDKHDKGTKVIRTSDGLKKIAYPCPICGNRPKIMELDRTTLEDQAFITDRAVYCLKCDTWPVDDAGGYYTLEEWNERAQYAYKLLHKVKELKTKLRKATYGSSIARW